MSFKLQISDDDILPMERIQCWSCEGEIIVYFSTKYNGQRGRCSLCEVDFPLE